MKKPQSIAENLRFGLAAHQQGRLADAERFYRAVLERKREDFDSLHLLGLIRWQQGRYQEALALITRAIRSKPGSAEARSNLGLVLHALNRNVEAVAAYDRSLAIKPGYAKALYGRGNTLAGLGRYEEALASYDQALLAAPAYVEVLINRGVVLRKLDRHGEALAAFDKVLEFQPDKVEIIYNRANSLQSLGRHEEAVAQYDKVLAADAKLAGAHNNRGLSLQALSRHEEAVAAFRTALGIDPGHADAHFNCGRSLKALDRYAEAAKCYEAALALGHSFARSLLADCLNHMGDWAGCEKIAQEMRGDLALGRFVDPFISVAVGLGAAEQLQAAQSYFRHMLPKVPARSWRPRSIRPDRIRIAYLSADYRLHATAYLMAELFELHDRNRFEIIGVSFGSDDRSATRARLVQAFDCFHDVRTMNDQAVAKRIEELDVHIAVDLKGHTGEARPGILAYRPAPIQVSYLGYPGTIGADFVDYVIADGIVLPFDQQPHYSEKIVHLPDCYQVNDSKRRVSPTPGCRRDHGLPDDGFVFCCFNSNYKITRPVFEVWMRLLRSMDGSVLWLMQANDAAVQRYRAEASARGIAPSRLVFAPKLPLEDHLGRHRHADLFLDTLPYNAHTTASDALWAGLPVLTCIGTTFSGRVGASMLEAVGMRELVTTTLPQYEAMALRLAGDRSLLHSLARRLEANRMTYPLFDCDRFRRHVEQAFTTMWDRYRRGESPEPFRVEATGGPAAPPSERTSAP
jgi:protein O-GlcNAc transferase